MHLIVLILIFNHVCNINDAYLIHISTKVFPFLAFHFIASAFWGSALASTSLPYSPILPHYATVGIFCTFPLEFHLLIFIVPTYSLHFKPGRLPCQQLPWCWCFTQLFAITLWPIPVSSGHPCSLLPKMQTSVLAILLPKAGSLPPTPIKSPASQKSLLI